MAHPALLPKLVEQYEALRALNVEDGSPALQQRIEDVAYTLCISTSTGDVTTALAAAQHRLPGARPWDDSVVAE